MGTAKRAKQAQVSELRLDSNVNPTSNSDATLIDHVRLVDHARHTLEIEAAAILAMTESINQKFIEAVQTILRLQSGARLIVSGMGKAGFIAMKVSATFASTGTPSFFLHPAEALHGDLGRFGKGDIVLIFSNSGETPEILKMLGTIKRFRCPVIAVTGKVDSQLAQHSDTVISIGCVTEADRLNLAPTASTTAMLALGDALAMAVIEERGFSKEQFAQFHPGGSLGRQLMQVNEIMRRGDEHAIVAHTTVTREALRIYHAAKRRPGCATVVDDNNELLGIFTDGDLRRLLSQGVEFLDEAIGLHVTKNPKSITGQALAQEALSIMSENKIDQLIVVNNANHPVGLLDIQDVIEIKV